MRKSVTISLWLCATLLLPGCPRINDYEKQDPVFIEQAREQYQWKKIAVLPFSGSPESRDIAADWIAHKLRIEKLIEIISPMAAKAELKKHAIIVGDQLLSLPEAQRFGAILGVDAVLVGSFGGKVVGSFDDRETGIFDGLVVSASLVDVVSGTVVVTSVHTSKPSAEYTERTWENTTGLVGRDIVAVLQKMELQSAKTVPPNSGTTPATGR